MVLTLEGRVENGQIHLRDDIALPENTKVLVVVSGEEVPSAHIGTPRLLHPEQMTDFKKTLTKINDDAAL